MVAVPFPATSTAGAPETATSSGNRLNHPDFKGVLGLGATQPKSAKSLAPTASELLRKSHNKNQLLNRTLQINSLPAAVGLGALAYPSQESDER